MDESKIENTLSKLSNDSSKLLYLISYIFGQGKINKQQKIKLKELVCQEKELVFNLLINYKNITNFIDSAKLVVMNSEITKDQTKSTVHKALISVLSQNQIKQNEFDDLPSPQGNLMMKMKKLKQKKKKQNCFLKNAYIIMIMTLIIN